MIVRFCTHCHMFHPEDSQHLKDDQFYEALEHDVYHANGTIYFSEDYGKQYGKTVKNKKKPLINFD